MQQEFLKSCEGFLRDALTVPSPVWKIAKMALFDLCIIFDFFQKMSQAPFSSVQVLIWEDKLDYLKNPSQDFKNYFCLGFLWIPSN